MRIKDTDNTHTTTFASLANPGGVGTHPIPGNFARADEIVIDAFFTAPPSGALDVYLQRRIGNGANGEGAWADLAAWSLEAGTRRQCTASITGVSSFTVDVGGGTDATPTPALEADAVLDMLPGGPVRLVTVAGAGTAQGAEQSITLTPFEYRT